jgi:flagellar hook-basal body complex protein FliE
MADPTISGSGLTPIRPIQPATTAAPTAKTQAPSGKDFGAYLLDSLQKVSQLQQEANAGVQKLMTGETNNVAEVFTATRKASVAFDLLMEIRNKLMDAYTELKQMRV